jgi:hypothetical protein
MENAIVEIACLSTVKRKASMLENMIIQGRIERMM